MKIKNKRRDIMSILLAVIVIIAVLFMGIKAALGLCGKILKFLFKPVKLVFVKITH